LNFGIKLIVICDLPLVRNQLGTPGCAKSFRKNPKYITLRPIDLNYVQSIFPGTAKIFLGVLSPCASLVTGMPARDNSHFMRPVIINRFPTAVIGSYQNLLEQILIYSFFKAVVPNRVAAAPWGAIYSAQGCRGLARF